LQLYEVILYRKSTHDKQYKHSQVEIPVASQ
jgi:hypothetical protein